MRQGRPADLPAVMEVNHTRAFDVYGKLGFEVAFEAEVWEATFP